MGDSTAIKVENLSKIFKLYDKPIDRLKESLSLKRSKYHREHFALDNVSFEIKKGDSIGIIGKNGSGKSTLLKIITGVLSPSGGKVTTNGKISALLELGAGFNPEYSGYENIYLNGAMVGLNKHEVDNLMPEILEFADIGDFIYQPVKTYSSGMFVRLAFAFSICVKPDILIIDEALSVGDYFFVQKCYKKLEEIMSSGVTVIFVTHNMSDMLKYCKKAVYLKDGKVFYSGDSLIAMQKYLGNEASESFVQLAADFKEPSRQSDVAWIPENCLVELSHANIEGGEYAYCSQFGISNINSEPTKTFKVGETIKFYIEYKVLQDMDIPVCGITLVDGKGNIIHGKHSMHHQLTGLNEAKGGMIIRCTFEVKLDIAPGEYTYILGLSSMNSFFYNNSNMISNYELLSNLKRIVHISKINTFNVYGGSTNFGTPFNGLCDLTGNCIVDLI